MERAGFSERVHALMAESTAEGTNGWFESRERLQQTAGFVADIGRAAALVAPLSDAHQVSLACRYALIGASLSSLAASIPGPLIARLVETGVWSALQGVTYISRISPRHFQNDAIEQLAPHLPAAVATLALGEPEEGERWDWVWAERAGLLAPRLGDAAGRVLTRLVDSILEAERLNDFTVVHSLRQVVPNLPAAEVQRLLGAAVAMPSGERRCDVIRALLPRLSESDIERLLVPGEDVKPDLAARLAALGDEERALEIVQELPEPRRSYALVLTAPFLRLKHVRKAHEMAASLDDEAGRTRAVLKLARRIGDFEPGTALKWASDTLNRVVDPWDQRSWWIASLAAVGRCIPREHLSDVVGRSLGHGGAESGDREVIEELAPVLPRELALECLEAFRQQNRSDLARGPILALLLRRLALLEGGRAALDRVPALETSYYDRAAFMKAVAPLLDEPGLAHALNSAIQIANSQARADAIAALAPYLGADAAMAALRSVRGVRDDGARLEAVIALAPYAPVEAFPAALAAAAADVDPMRRLRLLLDLAARAPASVIPQVLEIAWDLGLASEPSVLGALAPHLAVEHWSILLGRTFAIPAPGTRASVAELIAHHVPLALAERFEREVREHVVAEHRADVLNTLALRLARDGDSVRALSLADEQARGSDSGPYHAGDILEEAALRLRGEALQFAVQLCREIMVEHPESALKAAAALAERLAGERLDEEVLGMLEAVKREVDLLLAPRPDGSRRISVPDLGRWVHALVAVGQRRSRVLRDRVRDLARWRIQLHPDAEALARLRPYVDEALVVKHLDDAVGTTSVFPELTRGKSLPWVSELLDPHAFEAHVRSSYELIRSAFATTEPRDHTFLFLLEPLAPLLPPDLLREALRSIHRIPIQGQRATEELIRRAVLDLNEPELALEAVGVCCGREDAGALLATLSPLLPRSLVARAFRTALTFEDIGARREGISALAARIGELPRPEATAILIDLIAERTRSARSDLVLDLGAFGPGWVAVGGATLAGWVSEAIQAVGGWWP